jgi:hypothetical protein
MVEIVASGPSKMVTGSVADPDPYVFGLSGSEFISQRYGSGSFYHPAKIVKNTLIPTVVISF